MLQAKLIEFLHWLIHVLANTLDSKQFMSQYNIGSYIES